MAVVALALVGPVGLTGCGDGYDLPALASSSPPVIRVLLRTRGLPTLRLPEGAWRVTGEGGRAYDRTGRGAVEATLAPGRDGIVLGGSPTGSPVLRVHSDVLLFVGDVPYPGELLVRQEEGKLQVINEVDLETYVAGVISNEMAPQAAPAAYRAQAVAARTYGWIRLRDGPDRAFHVYDSQSSQVYSGLKAGYGTSYDDMRRRTAETRGVVLTWENRPFPAYYSSTCGGHTTEPATSSLDAMGAESPLQGVRCEFCTTSPRFSWEKAFSDDDLVQGLERRGRPILAPVHEITVSEPGNGGWAREVTVVYGPQRRHRKVPGTEFRTALGLDSHHIVAFAHEGGRWIARGRGWGHGVGMCQWGAMEMSRRGMSESDILRWYYRGATFTKLY